jgi:hypothetical protein
LDCHWRAFPFLILGIEGVRWVLLGVTALAGAGVVHGGLVSYGNYQVVRGETGPDSLDPTGRFRFMALFGMLASGLFLISLVWSLVPVFTTEICPFF